jgi:anti-sigma regulatory factor (Ser/Thr protein kinase)
MPQQLELAPELTSPRDARLFVAQWIRLWGYPRILNAATLLTSELATNAVVHGGGAFTVAVSNTGRGIRVEVRDDAPGDPVVRPLPEIDTAGSGPGGRGLHVVEALAESWGVDRDEATGTKSVWFELDAASGSGLNGRPSA